MCWTDWNEKMGIGCWSLRCVCWRFPGQVSWNPNCWRCCQMRTVSCHRLLSRRKVRCFLFFVSLVLRFVLVFKKWNFDVSLAVGNIWSHFMQTNLNALRKSAPKNCAAIRRSVCQKRSGRTCIELSSRSSDRTGTAEKEESISTIARWARPWERSEQLGLIGLSLVSLNWSRSRLEFLQLCDLCCRYFKQGDDVNTEDDESKEIYSFWHRKLADYFSSCDDLERRMEVHLGLWVLKQIVILQLKLNGSVFVSGVFVPSV